MAFLDEVAKSLRSRRYRPVEGLVTTSERVYSASGAFSIGLPWPWYVIDDPSAMPGGGSELMICAPRTDGGSACMLFSVDDDHVDLDDSTVNRDARLYSRQFPGASWDRPRRLIIDGLPGVEFIAEDAAEHHRHLLVPSSAKTYHVQTMLPTRVAPGYAVHVDTVYASWEWS